MLTTDRAAGGVLILLGLFVAMETWRLGYPLGTLGNPGPAFTPLVLAGLVLAFGVALVLTARGAVGSVDWSGWRHAVAILLVAALSTGLLERIGYRLTIMLMLFSLVWLVERKHPFFAAAFAVALALATFSLFDGLLRVPLPRGPFGL
jgi:putative tricarboxylic transport membrane protein